MVHRKPQCFQCYYEKTCNGVNYTDVCQPIEMSQYRKLVAHKNISLQASVDAAIDVVKQKQSDLQNIILADPRNVLKIRLDRNEVDSLLKSSFVTCQSEDSSNISTLTLNTSDLAKLQFTKLDEIISDKENIASTRSTSPWINSSPYKKGADERTESFSFRNNGTNIDQEHCAQEPRQQVTPQQGIRNNQIVNDEPQNEETEL